MPKGIHKGAVTHHHDHVITLVNFKVKKIKNNKVDGPHTLILMSRSMLSFLYAYFNSNAFMLVWSALIAARLLARSLATSSLVDRMFLHAVGLVLKRDCTTELSWNRPLTLPALRTCLTPRAAPLFTVSVCLPLGKP